MSGYYDLVVIGSGPAGEKGAAEAAYFGKKVALVERAPRLGGASISWGIPSKALRETALYFSGLRQRGWWYNENCVKEEGARYPEGSKPKKGYKHDSQDKEYAGKTG